MKSKSLLKIPHKTPIDLRKRLDASDSALITWEDITPLSRNEWICWIESAKKIETRNHRINRAIDSLSKGKRRPCCWAGCAHR